jgi:spermidine synthase
MQFIVNLGPIAGGSLLLFLIQPLMAKSILPVHGGAAAVWTACLFFFQTGLLAGYYYAFLISKLSFANQRIVHSLLVLLSLCLLPVGVPANPPDVIGRPELEIVRELSLAIGLPYLLLAATNPLVQRWAVQSQGKYAAGDNVFGWYAISNLGSLIGLAAYPFAIEPFASVQTQVLIWSVGYVLFVGLIGLSLWTRTAINDLESQRASLLPEEPVGIASRVPAQAKWGAGRQLLCVALPLCSSVVLAASTSQISQVGVVVPFLWVLPLTLYLGSFVVCFQFPSLFGNQRWVGVVLAAGFLACGLLLWGSLLPIVWQITGYCTVVFVVSTGCHSELYSQRPLPQHLTTYYLFIALGGALAGIFTGLVAPNVFSGLWEFHVGIAASVLLMSGCALARIKERLLSDVRARNVQLPGVVLSAGFVLVLLIIHRQTVGNSAVDRQRDFFGVVSVVDDQVSNRRLMVHGSTQHGMQRLVGENTADDTMYYASDSGIATAITSCRETLNRPLSLGVIGLGTGSLLIHAQPGEPVEFYELSPAVERIARSYFSYLSNHHGKVTVNLGDGRLLLYQQLNQTGSRGFDVLVIDAFSGDAIPMHLLTVEALQLYRQHLSEGDAFIAIHITNRYLDLAPVVCAAAHRLGMSCLLIESKRPAIGISQASPGQDPARYSSDSPMRWILLAESKSKLPSWAQQQICQPSQTEPWTDSYGSLWSALR